MSAVGILTRPVPDGDLRTDIVKLARTSLEENGVTGIKITFVDHEVSASSDKATVYQVGFETDDGTNLLEMTVFANGTHQVVET